MPRGLEVGSYDIDLDIDFPKAHLKGTVDIEILHGEDPLVLDAEDLKIQDVRVGGSVARFTHDPKKGTLRIRRVPKGKSRVTIRYEKQVSDEVIFGLYKSKYGKDYFLATDLEPSKARTVFPCKDHPAFKAAFRLSITTQKGLSVISNTPLASQTAKGGKDTFVFSRTPRMSTYLLFFCVGKIEQISSKENGKEVTIAARPGEAENGRFILDLAQPVLKHYQDYFGIPYPLQKLHLVALPEYHTGAMENWGAITSREAYVLLPPSSAAFDKQYAGIVMAHEIAHQWFGDLVTMKWWDDLWLNESFATFMECKAIDAIHPEWNPWTFFLRTQTFRSQGMDALSTTHPIQVRLRSPEEAQSVFDAISYGKGAAVLRMIESYVGEEAFRKGVAAYLKKFSYSNATGEDLWKSVQKSSGHPVTRIMGGWVTKKGFPVVSLDYKDGRLSFRQSRFLLSGEESPGTWPIPLTMDLNGKRKTMLFDKPRMSIAVPDLKRINVNVGHTGFYSVLCAPEIYEMIAANFENLEPNDKGGLMGDLNLFLKAGKISPDLYFRFVSMCNTESHRLAVETVAEQLLFLYSVANESRRLREACVAFAEAQIERIGLNAKKNEGPEVGLVRESISNLLSRLDTDYTAKLASMFSSYDSIDPNLREAAVVAYARTKGKEAFEPLLKLAKSMTNEVDRGKVYAALTSFDDQSLVEKALELGISGEVSRSDSGYTLMLSSFNPRARDTVWNWIQKRYDKLWELYAGSQQILLYYELAVPRCAVDRPDEVRKFLSGERAKQGGMSFDRINEALGIWANVRAKLLAD